MKYKLIALDLDDTLLLPDGTLHHETKIAIEKAQEKGVHIVLASGRPTSGMLNIAKQLNLSLKTGYIISFNGGRIINYGTNEVIFSADITKDQLNYLHNFSKKNDTCLLTYLESEIIVSQPSVYAKNECGFANLPMRQCDEFMSVMPDTLPKAMMLQEPEYLSQIEKKIKPLMEDKMFITISKPYFLEFMNKEVDKGASLIRLANILDIKIEEVIAIGDSYNDLTMIKAAGLGVAMSNSVDAVKDIADLITTSNEENGVAKVINDLILN